MLAEDIGTFELFEKDINRVQFSLNSPENFIRDNDNLKHAKKRMPMEDMSNFIRDINKCIGDEMSFIGALASLLKLPKNRNDNNIKSSCNHNFLQKIEEFAEKSRMYSAEFY